MATLGKHKKELVTFLQDHPIAALSTINAKGTIESTPIYFYVGDDLTVRFITKTKTRKLQNILDNPAVTVLIYDGTELASAEIQGFAEVINDAIEFAKTIEKFHSTIGRHVQKQGALPIARIRAGSYIACVLRPKHIYFRKFSSAAKGAPTSEEFAFA